MNFNIFSKLIFIILISTQNSRGVEAEFLDTDKVKNRLFKEIKYLWDKGEIDAKTIFKPQVLTKQQKIANNRIITLNYKQICCHEHEYQIQEDQIKKGLTPVLVNPNKSLDDQIFNITFINSTIHGSYNFDLLADYSDASVSANEVPNMISSQIICKGTLQPLNIIKIRLPKQISYPLQTKENIPQSIYLTITEDLGNRIKNRKNVKITIENTHKNSLEMPTLKLNGEMTEIPYLELKKIWSLTNEFKEEIVIKLTSLS